MSVRNLDSLFKPKSVALIGASTREHSVGQVLARNLFHGGFDGPIMPVHPHHSHIQSVAAYPDIDSLPMVPDLAVIATPPDTVPSLIAELGAAGTKGVVVITAGFGEGGHEAGQKLRQQMLDAAKPHLLRVVGPNCLGIMLPGIGLNASFGATQPRQGRLAFVAQSGAVVTSVIDWATARAIGFSHLVSLGDMSDVDFGDMLDYLASDRDARAVLLYVEAITHARKFISAARAASRMKPVIVVKAGRYEEGARAAASHTGAMAGSDEVYDAAFRRAGMLRVESLDELFDAVETLGMIDPPHGDRVAIVTNGGGIGVLATDALIGAGGRLADLSQATLEGLDKVLPQTWSHANPVDIIGDASGERYAEALKVLLEDKDIDATLVFHCPTAIVSGTEAARAVIDVVRAKPKTTVLTNWLGDGTAREARRLFAEARIPTYDLPLGAVRAFMHMVNYRRAQQALIETPPSIPEEFRPDTEKARTVIAAAVGAGRTWLTEPEAKDVLSAYAIPVASTEVAKTGKEAAALAAKIGGTVALKILSPQITHKSDVGGVALDIEGPKAVEQAAAAMLERIKEAAPEATIEGFTVAPMIRRPGAHELIVGLTEDAQFGPVVLFGHGGTAAETIADKALAILPLNMHLARDVMSRTHVYRLLRGYRDQPAANLDAIALTLIKVSQLAVDFAEIAELDINPLLADEYGVMALDARIRVQEAEGVGADRLAIRPYPKELEESIPVGDGRTLLLRPVVPEDEPSLHSGFAKLTPEEVRLRFFVPLKTLSHVQAARFTQIDYDREMALILTEPGIPGETEIYGVVRINADPDNERAEYAVIVRGDMTGMGLGVLLMRRIIDYARNRGIGEIFGEVLKENQTMLKLCKLLGFTQKSNPTEPSVVTVTLKL
jgi:acetyltransferase